METVIDSFYSQHSELRNFLTSSGEISLKSMADGSFSKVLVLASASFFEDSVCQIIQENIEKASNGNEIVLSLIKKKALNRQFHTLFDWDRNNANKLFSFFGDTSKTKHENDLKNSPELKEIEAAFMYLCRTRNTLVHTNFAQANLDDTPDEIYQKFSKAKLFLNYLKEHVGCFVGS